jgi:hypothetical protein
LTDNQGRYRLANVPPGRYYIMAGVVGEATYYPATSRPNAEGATIVTVAPGSTTDNLNFRLLLDIGRRVSGRVTPNTGLAPDVKATLAGSRVEEHLTVPLAADGSFEFGRVPPGTYLLSLFPPPAGLMPASVAVRDVDITGLQIVPPPTRTVTGRIVVQNGPIPEGILGFYTTQTYVGAAINPDGTFSVKLHAARHRADVAGMPVGYSLNSVRLGNEDVTQGFTVANADVSGITINVTAPRRLPRVRGRVVGLPPARLAAARVEFTGPIVGTLETGLQGDGSFEFPAVTPGLYTMRLLQVPEFQPMRVAVVGRDVVDVQASVSPR